MTDLDWAALGADGRALRSPAKVSVEEILCGFFGTADADYAVCVVLSQYQHARDALPIHEGDRVRVRQEFWHLGNSPEHAPGWVGYAPMFADALGTVHRVIWNPYRDRWAVDVEYPEPYYWSDYIHDFYVKDHPRIFRFGLRHLDVVS